MKTNKILPKRSFLSPFVTMSINTEGISRDKEVLLSDLCKEYQCDFLLIQETHRGSTRPTPKIDGMKMILERPHERYGIAIFARPGIRVTSASLTDRQDIEILTVRTQQYNVTSVYKPPESDFVFIEPGNFSYQDFNFVLGDFNCENTSWGYKETNSSGVELETRAEVHDLLLINDPKQPSSFNSGRWKKGYNPVNIFVSKKLASQCGKLIGEPIPHTQHRPIIFTFNAVVKPGHVPFKRRFNFKKANWKKFRELIDVEITKIPPQPEIYDSFVKLVQKVSRKIIPRGCRNSILRDYLRTQSHYWKDTRSSSVTTHLMMRHF
ncbi:uncharacterized protein LOC126299492 [Schistocerca gregaria]|uniref:uncharacterized protein LOC126299492 n=1 Tax=Schistocerca gregaria TaxID=7010 RepID=UPI00211E0EC2|nr:uncharacterized protein LOC126299492 [Schistocerca gregaria]